MRGGRKDTGQGGDDRQRGSGEGGMEAQRWIKCRDPRVNQLVLQRGDVGLGLHLTATTSAHADEQGVLQKEHRTQTKPQSQPEGTTDDP